MAIPRSFIDDLVGRTDIADLVGSYVKLTKRSGSNIFGLCPFHSEKTGSFCVNSDKQRYHCFGCGKGGGVINFVMEIENLPYRDAIEFLAKRAGMAVPEESETATMLAGKRRRMLEMNRDAARHFHEILLSPQGEAARSYLASRRVAKTMVTRFGIGAAPDSWTILLDAMTKKGYSKQELAEGGLIRRGKKEGAFYDYFRNRLMFPVINVNGGVTGFSGRILGDGEPKYLNSPDTIVFSKSRNLFGLNLAKKTKSGMLILVEGNIDVVTLHQFGFDGAVASLGTSLTADQARLMTRYCEKVVLAYDSDKAGRMAAMRAIEILEKTNISVKVIDMRDAKDPDEFLLKHGADAFKLLIERGSNNVEYRLMTIGNKFDLSSDEGRISYLAATTDLLSELYSKPEREIYGARVANAAGVSTDAVASEVEKKIKSNAMKQRKEQNSRMMHPAAAMQPPDRTLRYENEYSAKAEESLIVALMGDPALMKTAADMSFAREEFTSPFLAKVFDILIGRISEDKDTREALIMSELEPNEASLLAQILDKNGSVSPHDKTLRDNIEKIRMEKYRNISPDSDLLLEIKLYKENKDNGGIQHG